MPRTTGRRACTRYADDLDKLLKERAENGTYDVVPETTPRHRY